MEVKVDTDNQPTTDDVFFSVVIPSRNRPALLTLAIESVANQSFRNIEIIVVNDGSDEEYAESFDELKRLYPDRLRVITLVRYPRGHGQSYAINTGVYNASGKYCTFLDDDDFWTDPEHLEKAYKALGQSPNADVYYTNQVAVAEGKQSGKLLWLWDLEGICTNAGVKPDDGVYAVTVELLMKSDGFSHLNTTIVRRSLFKQVNGLDEDIRWQCDLDFYYRTIEKASLILYRPDVVSQHNVPSPAKGDSMTTSISMYQRWNYHLYVHNKTIALSTKALIRKRARQHKAYTLQKMAQAKLATNAYQEAGFYAREALFLSKSITPLLILIRTLFK